MTTEMVTGKTKTWMWSDDHTALLAERDALRAALERVTGFAELMADENYEMTIAENIRRMARLALCESNAKTLLAGSGAL